MLLEQTFACVRHTALLVSGNNSGRRRIVRATPLSSGGRGTISSVRGSPVYELLKKKKERKGADMAVREAWVPPSQSSQGHW